MGEKRQNHFFIELSNLSKYRIISTTTVYGQKTQMSGWQNELLRGTTSADSKTLPAWLLSLGSSLWSQIKT